MIVFFFVDLFQTYFMFIVITYHRPDIPVFTCILWHPPLAYKCIKNTSTSTSIHGKCTLFVGLQSSFMKFNKNYFPLAIFAFVQHYVPRVGIFGFVALMSCQRKFFKHTTFCIRALLIC